MGQWWEPARRLFTGVAVVCAILMADAGQASAQAASPLIPLVDASAQRLRVADAVAAYKWVNAQAIEDPHREEQVLDTVTRDAAAKQIDTAYVANVFRNQMDATAAIQYSRFADWEFDPATAPTAAPDLAPSRAAIDALNATMVNEIQLQWNSLHGPACALDLAGAVGAVVAARRLDSLYQRALASATRSYCS